MTPIKITNIEIEDIAKRIQSLSLNNIDNLWKECGWVDSEAEEDKRKSLPNWRLKKIKKDKKFAEESFVNLITDDPYSELRTASLFLTNLSKLEKSNK